MGGGRNRTGTATGITPGGGEGDGPGRHAGGRERGRGRPSGSRRGRGRPRARRRKRPRPLPHPPKVAWLLFLPALSLLFYAPPALGAFTASRETPKAVAQEEHFDPLPTASPLPMTLTDFTQRVQQDRERAIQGRTVQLTGFVTPAPPVTATAGT
ncbi:hypothetical protein GCM10020295_34130 [Streptomyces cinereospinus]